MTDMQNNAAAEVVNVSTVEASEPKARSSKNSKDVYGAVGKTNVLVFRPETLKLVTDKSNPLYDVRVELPIDERLVRNLMHYGQIQPGRVRKNPENGDIEVEVGRQRVKCMIEANKRLVERGHEPLLFQAIVQRGDDDYRMGVGVSENMIRQSESPLTIAEKVQRMTERGAPEETICTTFGFGKQTVKNYLALLECTAVVRNAVEAGKITVTHALALSKLDPDKQRETVKAMIDAQDAEDDDGEGSGGGGKGSHAKAKAAREAAEAAGAVKAKLRGKKEVNALREKIEAKCGDEDMKAFAMHLLDWFAGGREPRIPSGKKQNAA